MSHKLYIKNIIYLSIIFLIFCLLIKKLKSAKGEMNVVRPSYLF